MFSEIPHLERFKSLEILDLANNRLKNLDEIDFDDLKTIKKIDLSRNLFISLPHGIIKLPLLQSLLVHRNQLEFFPKGIKELKSLVVLNAEYNCLRDIGNELNELPKLSDLNLYGNPNLNVATMTEKIKRLHDVRILIGSGDLRKGAILRTHRLVKTHLNEEQSILFPEINGFSKYTSEGYRNPNYVDTREHLNYLTSLRPKSKRLHAGNESTAKY